MNENQDRIAALEKELADFKALFAAEFQKRDAEAVKQAHANQKEHDDLSRRIDRSGI